MQSSRRAAPAAAVRREYSAIGLRGRIMVRDGPWRALRARGETYGNIYLLKPYRCAPHCSIWLLALLRAELYAATERRRCVFYLSLYHCAHSKKKRARGALSRSSNALDERRCACAGESGGSRAERSACAQRWQRRRPKRGRAVRWMLTSIGDLRSSTRARD